MLLALDMGNTNITIGVYEKDSLRFESRLATDCAKMEDQYAVEIMDILRLYGIEPREIEGAIISSVVPPLDRAIAGAVSYTHLVRLSVETGGKGTGFSGAGGLSPSWHLADAAATAEGAGFVRALFFPSAGLPPVRAGSVSAGSISPSHRKWRKLHPSSQ